MSTVEHPPTRRRRIMRALSAPARWVLLAAWGTLMVLGALVSALAMGLLALALRVGGSTRTRIAGPGIPRDFLRAGAPA